MKPEAVTPTATLVMEIGRKTFYPRLDESLSAAALFRMLESGPFNSVLRNFAG